MTRCIALFHDGWADWEAGPVLSALCENFGADVAVATPEGASVRSIGGVRAQADLAWGDVRATGADILLVIGSAKWMKREEPVITRLLRDAASVGTLVGGICGGTVALAYAGLLDARRHTGNDVTELTRCCPTYRGAAHYVDQPRAVSDGRVVTASGTAPYTFASEILRLADAEKGPGVAAEFEKYARLEWM